MKRMVQAIKVGKNILRNRKSLVVGKICRIVRSCIMQAFADTQLNETSHQQKVQEIGNFFKWANLKCSAKNAGMALWSMLCGCPKYIKNVLYFLLYFIRWYAMHLNWQTLHCCQFEVFPEVTSGHYQRSFVGTFRTMLEIWKNFWGVNVTGTPGICCNFLPENSSLIDLLNFKKPAYWHSTL